MDKFHVGQMVRVVVCHNNPEFLGSVVTITKKRHWLEITAGRNVGKQVFAYETDFVCGLGRLIAEEYQLAPIHDGWQTTTWDQCMWRPKAREAV